jgi:organic radical activating enzyme
LKYVCDGSERIWAEVERATELYRQEDIIFPVWIMPMGGTREALEENQAMIADEAIIRGYYVSARVHCFLYGNMPGR